MPSATNQPRRRRHALLARPAWAARVATAALAVCSIAAPASAQQSGRKVEAEALFDRAKGLTAQGDYAHACPLFIESLRLDPGLGTMLWLADCYENNGQTASAWAEFKEAAGAAGLRKDAREKVARDHAAALEPKLSKLVLRVPAPAGPVAGLEVRRDGELVTVAQLGLELPVDPGPHTIEARAPGRKSWTTKVNVPPTANVVAVEVPALEALPAPTEPPPPDGPPTAPPAVEPGPSGRGLRTTGLVVGGGGIVVLGVATFLSFDAKSTYDASNKNNIHCQPNYPKDTCDQTGLNDRSTANALATVATVGFVVGAAAVVGGVIAYFVAPRPATATAGTISFDPVLTPKGGSLTVGTTW